MLRTKRNLYLKLFGPKRAKKVLRALLRDSRPWMISLDESEATSLKSLKKPPKFGAIFVNLDDWSTRRFLAKSNEIVHLSGWKVTGQTNFASDDVTTRANVLRSINVRRPLGTSILLTKVQNLNNALALACLDSDILVVLVLSADEISALEAFSKSALSAIDGIVLVDGTPHETSSSPTPDAPVHIGDVTPHFGLIIPESPDVLNLVIEFCCLILENIAQWKKGAETALESSFWVGGHDITSPCSAVDFIDKSLKCRTVQKLTEAGDQSADIVVCGSKIFDENPADVNFFNFEDKLVYTLGRHLLRSPNSAATSLFSFYMSLVSMPRVCIRVRYCSCGGRE